MKINKKMFRFMLFIPFALLITVTAMYLYRFYATSDTPIDISVLSDISAQEEWIVIISPYAPFKVKPDSDASSEGHTRKGEIFKVTGKRLVQSGAETNIWYLTDKGWISSKSASVYTNKFRAQNAAKKMLF